MSKSGGTRSVRFNSSEQVIMPSFKQADSEAPSETEASDTDGEPPTIELGEDGDVKNEVNDHETQDVRRKGVKGLEGIMKKSKDVEVDEDKEVRRHSAKLLNGTISSDTEKESQRPYVKELCTKCKSLNLTPEKFIIDDRASTSKNDAPNSYLARRAEHFTLNSRSSKVYLGTLEGILKKSSSCPFCSLVCLSVKNHTDPSHIKSPQEDLGPSIEFHQENPKCYMLWEVDGRLAADVSKCAVKGRTRRIHIFWSDKKLQDCYLVFVAPEKYYRPNSDAQSVWKDEALFLGREIQTGGRQSLIKSWLDLCFKSHRGPCREKNDEHERFHAMVSQSYFGVIDVYDMRLTSLPYSGPGHYDSASRESPPPKHHYSKHSPRSRWVYEPYVCLSYCWGRGKKDPYTTDLSNVNRHRINGSLGNIVRELPQAIQDGIDLVRGLGVRYIWIDSLCIVQDSMRSWNLNARAMDLIYGNALLTICAADGLDSSTGLRAMHEKEVQQLSEYCTPAVRLMVSRSPEAGIRASAWDTRAWTFQERLLSKRCLIFTEGRVYFQCLSTGMSEDIFADRVGAGWSLDLVNAPLQIVRDLKRRPLWVYLRCVSLYTTRYLTKSKDILAAFSGMSNTMVKNMLAPFVFGLPSSHFDLALLWQPLRKVKRRLPQNDKEKDEYRGLEFPSWSWAGWIDGAVIYHNDMVEGCLTNVQEWLAKHTWICYYIRDGHGNLRPLWDATEFEENTDDISTEQRWRGYLRHGENRPSPSGSFVEIRDRERRPTAEYDERRLPRPYQYHTYPPPHQLASYPQQQYTFHPRQPPGTYQQPLVSQDPRNKYFSPPPPPPINLHHRRDDLDSFRQKESTGNAMTKASDVQSRRHQVRHWNTDYQQALRSDDSLSSLQSQPPHELIEGLSGDFNDDDPACYQKNEDYGRLIPPELRRKNQKRFNLTLPENPYRVVMADYTSEPDKEFPDQPVLQFWTWYSVLYIVPLGNRGTGHSSGLCRCDIADENGDWCGSIVVDQLDPGITKPFKCDFIAMSDAKAFTMDECENWTYYIPKDRDQSEWDLYYVLLIDREKRGGLKWQRIALGKVFKAAFSNAQWREIILG